VGGSASASPGLDIETGLTDQLQRPLQSAAQRVELSEVDGSGRLDACRRLDTGSEGVLERLVREVLL